MSVELICDATNCNEVITDKENALEVLVGEPIVETDTDYWCEGEKHDGMYCSIKCAKFEVEKE